MVLVSKKGRWVKMVERIDVWRLRLNDLDLGLNKSTVGTRINTDVEVVNRTVLLFIGNDGQLDLDDAFTSVQRGI